ncbi:5'/3'-nucleotidase SurE [Candidatus Micrarchaeota archaeon]|nr:5'/3'-nucleotidase SurE [Candidatus Micrarchaeota archaeon]
MAILVTNDDGYAPGVEVLFEAAKLIEKDSYAIIPNRQRSAVSKMLTLHKPMRVHEIEKNLYDLNGSPADCVTLGMFCRDFKKPDLVVSGINFGDNTSLHSFYSSGTIGACIEAVLNNVPAIAFSTYIPERTKAQIGRGTSSSYRIRKSWGNLPLLKKHSLNIIKKFKGKIPKGILLNVNIPYNVKNPKIVFAPDQRERFKVGIAKRKDPGGKNYYWTYGKRSEIKKGSAYDLIFKNKDIVITPFSVVLNTENTIEEIRGKI